MLCSKVTHIGLVRKGNEDRICVDEELNLFGVADGMGGHEAGEVASEMAVSTIISHLRQQQEWTDTDPGAALTTAVNIANKRVYEKAEETTSCRGMGTTIAVGLVSHNQMFVAHVGDSRVYLLHAGQLKQITQDHSLVNQLLLNGGITEAEAFNHPQRNVLLRALGTSPEVQVDVTQVSVLKGDRVLFCTDGLSGVLKNEEIQTILGSSLPVRDVVQELLDRALSAGGPDNITIVAVEVE